MRQCCLYFLTPHFSAGTNNWPVVHTEPKWFVAVHTYVPASTKNTNKNKRNYKIIVCWNVVVVMVLFIYTKLIYICNVYILFLINLPVLKLFLGFFYYLFVSCLSGGRLIWYII